MLQHLSAVIADDRNTSRQIIADMLRGAGMRDIRLAADGRQALAEICARPPSFLVLDCEMPHAGLITLRHVRASTVDAIRRLPVIMITACTTRARIEAMRDAGASEILTKPLTPAKLFARIDAAVANPRPFIDEATFVGPDRRRVAINDYAGPFRRAGDSKPDVFEIAC